MNAFMRPCARRPSTMRDHALQKHGAHPPLYLSYLSIVVASHTRIPNRRGLPLLANIRTVPFLFFKATTVGSVAPKLADAQENCVREGSTELKITVLEDGSPWPHPPCET